jgi:hypothetical protein
LVGAGGPGTPVVTRACWIEPLDPTAPYYGYGFVFIDASSHRIAIRPKDYSGRFIAGNGGTTAGGLDDRCYDYVAVAR